MENQTKANVVVHPDAREIVITHVFDAPCALVYQVYTDPKRIPQWWGPRRYTTTVDRMEVRPGGTWRYVQKDENGNVFAFHGVYREVISPERLVYTFEYEGMPGHEILESVSFHEHNGRTTIITTDTFKTLEDLEGMMKMGMEDGMNESYARLTELIRSLVKEKAARV